jgi:hypothetical protein
MELFIRVFDLPISHVRVLLLLHYYEEAAAEMDSVWVLKQCSFELVFRLLTTRGLCVGDYFFLFKK